MRSVTGGRTTLKLLVLIIGSLSAASCQATPSSPLIVDLDFKYQGEFIGKVETVSPVLGVQGVARGNGSFVAAFLLGGLPGMGWDTTSRTEQSGTLQADGVHFQTLDSSKEYSALISADGATISGKTPKGELFTLNKIIRRSPTLDSVPPPGINTTVLFNGKDLAAFVKESAVLDSGLLLPTGTAATGAVTLKTFGNFFMHLEFREPFMPMNTDQGRGNSGVYLQGRYELQILDSFGLNFLRNGEGPATQECGAFYQLVRPRLNMSFPPLSWQTYDIEFTKAKFDVLGKTLLDSAIVTVWQNGVIIHDHQKLRSNTLLGDSVKASDGPIRFQAHGDPVYYRNIWVVENNISSIHPILFRRSGQRFGNLLPILSLINGRRAQGRLSLGYYLYLGLANNSTILWGE